jgi:hypothetical protein
VKEAKIVGRLVESKLLPQPLLTLVQRADPSSDGGHNWRMVRLIRSTKAVLICQP